MAASFIEKVYHLRRDPFDTHVASLDAALRYLAGRQQEKEQWTQIIESRRGQSGNSSNFIVGSYGLGKTLSLYYIVAQFQDDPGLLVRYLKFLPEDTVPRFGVDFVQRIFRAVGAEYMQANLRAEPIQDFKRMLPEPANVFTRLLDGSPLAKVFLNGETSLSRAEMRQLGVVRKLDKTEVAKEYLLAFLVLLKHSGIQSLILAIDEVEYVFSQMRGAKLGNVLNTLRDFFDLPQSIQATEIGMPLANMILFFAISASGWKTLTELERREQARGGPIEPLRRRLDRVIVLTPLNEQESKQLIELRLRWNRVSKKPEKDPLIPYDENFVDYIFKLTRGNPGDIVKFCEYVLQDGIKQGVRLLTVDFAKKALADRGLATEPT